MSDGFPQRHFGFLILGLIGAGFCAGLCDGEYFTLLEAGLPDEVNSEDLFDG